MGLSGETKEQTAETVLNGERQKQAQAVAGAGQTAEAAKEILWQRQPICTEKPPLWCYQYTAGYNTYRD